MKNVDSNTRVYPKVSGLAAWSEKCKWHSSLSLDALIAISWLSLVGFAAITLCVVSQWVFIVVKCIFCYRHCPENFGYILALSIVRIVKSKSLRQAAYVTKMGGDKYAYKYLWGTLLENTLFKDRKGDARITVRRVLAVGRTGSRSYPVAGFGAASVEP
jgi:hypothetical protein